MAILGEESFDHSFVRLPNNAQAEPSHDDAARSLLKPQHRYPRKSRRSVIFVQGVCLTVFFIVATLIFVGSMIHWANRQQPAPGSLETQSKASYQLDPSCTPPVFDPDYYALHLWQSTRDASTVQAANENNIRFLPRDTIIHTLSDDDLTRSMKAISIKLEKCAGISGVFEAFTDLRPMAFRTDLYRAAQLWDTGGLWLDDKIWLTQDFSTFVDLSKDRIVLPLDADRNKDAADDGAAVQNGFLWSIPRHPVWEHIIRHIVNNVQQRLYFDDLFDPWFRITGPIAYLRGLQEYQNLYVTDTSVRRDLELFNPPGCGNHLPREFNHHSCDAYFTSKTGSDTVVAFRDLHTHNIGSDGSLHYYHLWVNHKVYCDVPITNAGDPCKKFTTSVLSTRPLISLHSGEFTTVSEMLSKIPVDESYGLAQAPSHGGTCRDGSGFLAGSNIPCHVHQTSKDTHHSSCWKSENLESRISGNEEVMEVLQLFPDIMALDHQITWIQRADIWRYARIYLSGGIYADTDACPVLNVDEWIPQWLESRPDTSESTRVDLLLGLESMRPVTNCGWPFIPFQINQWSFAAAAKSPVLFHVLQQIIQQILLGQPMVLTSTGPVIFSRAIFDFVAEFGEVKGFRKDGIPHAMSGILNDGKARVIKCHFHGKPVNILLTNVKAMAKNAYVDPERDRASEGVALVNHQFIGSWKSFKDHGNPKANGNNGCDCRFDRCEVPIHFLF